MTRVYDYFKLLFQTYKIFFKATLLISVVVVALTPLEALAPVLGGAGRPTLGRSVECATAIWIFLFAYGR